MSGGTELAVISPAVPKLLCARQDQIEISFDDHGNVEIIQINWPDENQAIRISRDNIQTFLDGVCEAFGILSIGGGK